MSSSEEAKDMEVRQLEDAFPEKMGTAPMGEPDMAMVAAEKKLMRKIDFRLLPILCALYTISLIDRTNLGGARISGIDEAIGLNLGNRYSVVVLVFYVGYIIFELPSNIALKRFGADIWLCFLALSFGLITVGMGLVKNYGSLVALRVLLGALEAGIFPACIYLVSAWYRRYEVQKRISLFFGISSFVSSFANVLAYGLTQIAGDPETGGWRYIFIVQGSISCGIAILAYFVLVDFPDSPRNTFLSPEEKVTLHHRLVSERGDAEPGKVTMKTVLEVLKMWHPYAIGLIYMGGSCAAYGFLFFLPIILRNSFHFSLVASFCLTAPPAAFGVLFAFAVSWLADKTRTRGPYVVIECATAITGLAMTGFLKDPIPRYVGTFLGQAGTTALISTSLAWGQNNVRDDARRSVVTVVQIVCAAIGGVYSALVFRQQDAPDYVPGLVALGALLLFDAVLAVGASFFLWRANKKADRGELVIEGSPEFRYTW